MRLVGYPNSDFEISRIDSLGELQELRSSGAINRIVDENIEASDSYFSIKATNKNLKLGIVAEGVGHNTGIVKLLNQDLIYNAQRWYLFGQEAELVSHGSCDGIVYDIEQVSDGFIIVHEIGASKFGPNGDFLWKINSDLVEDHRVEAGNLELVSDGIIHIYDIGNGKKIS